MRNSVITPAGTIGSEVRAPGGIGPMEIAGQVVDEGWKEPETARPVGTLAVERPRYLDGPEAEAAPTVMRPVSAAEAMLQRGVTLKRALAQIRAVGGDVRANPDTSVTYSLPSTLSPGKRRELISACITLDACREIVWTAILNDIELPDLEPALGGGVVE